MARKRHLSNAPISEAVIDFRVKLPLKFDLERFSSLEEVLGPAYPNKETKWEYAGEVQFVKGQLQQAIQHANLTGYIYRSGDGKDVAQFRRDGFTFSRLRPYSEWETVLTEAKRLWRLYADRASPEMVITRLAVRYINELNIPLPIHDFADYLTAPPTIPENLPQAVRHFMTRVVICDEASDIQANIIQALQKGKKPEEAIIILDIDVYKEQETGFEESTIWPTFEQLRQLKNDIFFDSITEDTARLFE